MRRASESGKKRKRIGHVVSRSSTGVRTVACYNDAILTDAVRERVAPVVNTWIAQSWGGALVLVKQLVDRKKEVGS
jgi:hypothetical protein